MHVFYLPFLFAVLYVNGLATPDSALDNALSELRNISTFRAQIHRIQIYKDFTQAAEGNVNYRRGAIWYKFTSPDKFLMIYTDSLLYSINLNKLTGHKERITKDLSLRKSDPLSRFFCLTDIPRNGFLFQGSYDSVLVFRNNGAKIFKEYVGLDRNTGRLSVIEWFDVNDVLIEQTEFKYKKGPAPVSIVTRSFEGGKLLVDSLMLIHPRVNVDISEESFQIPDNIHY